MVEKIKEAITIPRWVASIILATLLSITGFVGVRALTVLDDMEKTLDARLEYFMREQGKLIERMARFEERQAAIQMRVEMNTRLNQIK